MELNADFGAISMEREAVDAGEYIATVEEIEEGKTNESNLDMLTYNLRISGGKYDGRVLKEWVVLQQKKGGINEAGYGRVRAYHNAIFGAEAAAGKRIQTDEHVGKSVKIIVSKKTRVDKETKESRIVNEIDKVLPAN